MSEVVVYLAFCEEIVLPLHKGLKKDYARHIGNPLCISCVTKVCDNDIWEAITNPEIVIMTHTLKECTY